MVNSGIFRGERFVPKREIPDLEGQVYIVTGGTNGIGLGIVIHLLAHNPAKIIMLSSNEGTAKQAMERLNKIGDASRVTWQRCNLGSLQEVDLVARKLRQEEPRIDSLVLNAGIGVNKFTLSNDGIDNHFQINVLSQLHLALILLPTLRQTSAVATRPSRLIMMSSEMHRFAPLSTKFESIKEINTNVGSTFLYSRSKLAQLLIMQEMVRRADEGQLGFDPATNPVRREVLMNVTHPGGVRTPQQQQLVPAYGCFGWVLMMLIRPILVDPVDVGCLSGLFASTPTEGLLKGGGMHGKYIVPDKQISKPSGKARNAEMGKRLWTLSMALLQEKIGTPDYGFELLP